jgi:hypothetical protein
LAPRAIQAAQQAAEKGRGRCPWTPLGPSCESVLRTTAPDPDLLEYNDFNGLWLLVSKIEH